MRVVHENTSKANNRLLPSSANFQDLFPLSKAVRRILALDICNPSRRVHCSLLLFLHLRVPRQRYDSHGRLLDAAHIARG